MASPPRNLRLNNSESRGLSVLISVDDEKLAGELEGRFELDSEMSRINIFVLSSVKEIKDVTKTNKIDIAILSPETQGHSAAELQVEMIKYNPSTGFVIGTEIITLINVRMLNNGGNILDFCEASSFKNFDKLKDIILSSVRQFQKVILSKEREFEHIRLESIKQTIGLNFPDWLEQKNSSPKILANLMTHFDLNLKQRSDVVAAETVFAPWLLDSDYNSILLNEREEIKSILQARGTWLGPVKKPESVEGFLITTSNYIAEQMVAGVDGTIIANGIITRPIFLKHPAIRVLSNDILMQLTNASNLRVKGAS